MWLLDSDHQNKNVVKVRGSPLSTGVAARAYCFVCQGRAHKRAMQSPFHIHSPAAADRDAALRPRH